MGLARVVYDHDHIGASGRVTFWARGVKTSVLRAFQNIKIKISVCFIL